MVYRHKTNIELDLIKKEIALKSKEFGFGILKEYSFKTILKEKGFPIEKDITVYELCNPAAAQAALELHPEISIYLPCRISLYEENGQSVLSTIGIEDMLGTFELEDSFKEHMQSIFDKVKKLLNSW